MLRLEIEAHLVNHLKANLLLKVDMMSCYGMSTHLTTPAYTTVKDIRIPLIITAKLNHSLP